MKTRIWFILRGILWFFINVWDNPKLNGNIQGFCIGKTISWKEIRCYKFGTWKDTILYVGWIHGNEVWTVKLMTRWMNYLSGMVWDVDKTVYVIDCLNPDGYEKALKNKDYFRGWNIGKTNGNNVDLNRNFPTKNWSKTTKSFVSWRYYDVSGGKFPGSENEVRALIEFIQAEQIQEIYMFHNCWGTVMGTFTNETDELARQYSRLSGYRVFLQKDWDALEAEQKTGHSMVYGAENNLRFVEVELRTRYGSDWRTNKKALINTLNISYNL